jgi:MFS family permease
VVPSCTHASVEVPLVTIAMAPNYPDPVAGQAYGRDAVVRRLRDVGCEVAATGFTEVFAVGEFRALWLAQVLSVAGDQLARVALTMLVFDRTVSSLLAAVTFAATIVPTFVGGITFSGLADRWPRRRVMIACDLSRALLVALTALPGVPVAGLIGLLVLVSLISAPFTSARAALYPGILAGDRYVVGTAVTLITFQVALVLGFSVGRLTRFGSPFGSPPRPSRRE